MNEKIYKNMEKHGTDLLKYACKDEDAIYLKDYVSDIRTPYFRDIDKIIYSLSYIRYMDKTQVFPYAENDHIQTRMLHVGYVSKIARTIGRALSLNEDLIEAAALGHDLGHTPFGHAGESILNKISKEIGEGNFYHNLNSVRNLLFVENYGKGQNISMQVLDAIMCHNGEMVSNEYYPKAKTKDEFLKEYFDCYKNEDTARYLRPMTLEGCVVRISDVIAYLGRDIEDGVRMGLITYDDIPEDIKEVLGHTNSEIVNTIILDIIKNSGGLNCIKLSDSVFNAIEKLKAFNYKNIYDKSLSSSEKEELELMFRKMTKHFLSVLENKDTTSIIYTSYLNHMDKEYLSNTNERIVLDYISGMTDNYFQKVYNMILKEQNE